MSTTACPQCSHTWHSLSCATDVWHRSKDVTCDCPTLVERVQQQQRKALEDRA